MAKYFDLEISLLEIKPRIWRRFLIRSEATFMHFHSAIQQAFGWQNCHLYEFLDGKVEVNDTRPLYAMKLPRIARSEHAEPHDDEPDAPVANNIELRQYLSAKNKRCFYVYDFGDNWQHIVEVKDVVEMPEKFTCRLLDGARACPPEDCGGTMGYGMRSTPLTARTTRTGRSPASCRGAGQPLSAQSMNLRAIEDARICEMPSARHRSRYDAVPAAR